MATNDIRKTGRLLYVEPTYFKDGTKSYNSNDIINPYEDYCMAIDLVVKVVDRYSCGWGAFSGEEKEFNFSSSNGTISLNGGKTGKENDEYLTTNFTDVSLTNPDSNTSECLGIESISISYNNQLFPLVVIKFVDVRGSSLMSPVEQNYYSQNTLNSSDKLYRAFFTMPYPMFLLKVKGFYGEGATFKLALHKADIDFNSDTGNFNITASFIGYMYGIYADLPMSYIAVAPYMIGGREYWDEQVESGRFMFRDENGNKVAPMVRFPELKHKIANAPMNEDHVSGLGREKLELNNIKRKKEKLKTILSEYNSLFSSWGIFKEYKYKLSGKDDIRKRVDTFYELLNEYDKNYEANLKSTYFDIYGTSKEYNVITNNEGIKHIVEPDNSSDYVVINNDLGFSSQVNDDLNKGNNIDSSINNVVYLYYVAKKDSESGFTIHIQYIIDNLSLQEENLNAEYNNKRLEKIEKLINFRPSIRNIYELAFAHMETFMHCFYENTKRIKNQLSDINDKTRQKSHQGVEGIKDTDTIYSPQIIKKDNKTIELNKLLPPYTAFYNIANRGIQNEGLMEMVWPEKKAIHGGELEEVNFVNNLLYASNTHIKEDKRLNKPKNSEDKNSAPIDISGFIPITTYDFAHKDVVTNPYKNIEKYINQNEDNNIMASTFGIFALRAFYFLAGHSFIDGIPNNQAYANYQTDAADAIGKIEAVNFFKAIGDNKNTHFIKFIQKCHNIVESGKYNVFSEMLISKEDNGESLSSLWATIMDGQLFKKNGNKTYSFNSEKLPVGEFNFSKIKENTNTDKYISTQIPEIESSGNVDTNSFINIEDNGTYIDDLCDSINIEMDDASVKIVKFGNRNEAEYGPIKNQKGIVTKIKENFSIDKNIQYIDGTFSSEDKEFIKYPSWINEEKTDSLFMKNLQYLRDRLDNKMLAYLFLQSLPLSGMANKGNILKENRNGVVLKSLLLREGSYYWYLDQTNDYCIEAVSCVTMKSDIIKAAKGADKEYYGNDKIAMFGQNETLSFISAVDNSEYNKWDYPKYATPSRKEKLREYFETWAEKNSDIIRGLGNSELYEENEPASGLSYTLFTSGGDKAVEAQNVQLFLKDLFLTHNTIFDLYTDIKIKKGNQPNTEIEVRQDVLENSFKAFLKQIIEIYKNISNENDIATSIVLKNAVSEEFKNDDIRLATYMTLKSLYEKWLCSPSYGPTGTWTLDSAATNSDFCNFIYTDSFYNDIGDLFTVNLTKISNWLTSCLPTSNSENAMLSYTGKSVYNFLTEIAQDSGAMLLSLPQRLGAYNENRIKKLFHALPLNEKSITNEMSFVFMYTYKASEHLDNMQRIDGDINGYPNDGLDLTDEIQIADLLPENATSGKKYIPAFGVTYAKQNQSIFKNIRLNTAEGMTTDVVLAMTQNIATKNSTSNRESILFGQDIYKIFSNRSYKCEVETMGNIQIMPLMFFQLNNIPMWKGGYQIMRVNHEISAGNFITKFEGVRVNRNAIPIGSSVAFTVNTSGISDKIKNDNGYNIQQKADIGYQSAVKLEDIITQKDYETSLANKHLSTNKITQIKGAVNGEKEGINRKKPLICLTPAHSINSDKRLEHYWSSKVVNRMEKILSSDGYKVTVCNKEGKSYTMEATKTLINKYGSQNVVSLVPHWNECSGSYYLFMLDYMGKERPDSYELYKYGRETVKECTIPEDWKNIMLTDNDSIKVVPSGYYSVKNSEKNDGAPRLNCACILTENWFADTKKDGTNGSTIFRKMKEEYKNKYQNKITNKSFYDYINDLPEDHKYKNEFKNILAYWLLSDDGIDFIANLNANMLKKYISKLI